jgi:hypothetical protein
MWQDRAQDLLIEKQIRSVQLQKIDPCLTKAFNTDNYTEQCSSLPTYSLMPKLHKDGIASRGLSNSGNVPMTALSTMIADCLPPVLVVLNRLWIDLTRTLGLADVNGCPIISSSVEIRRRFPNYPADTDTYKFPGRHLELLHHIFSADFGTLYTVLPHLDFVSQLRRAFIVAFDEQAKPEHGGFRTLQVELSLRRSKGRRSLDTISWSTKKPSTPTVKPAHVTNYRDHVAESTTMKHVDAARLADWLALLMSNTLVVFDNTVYKQVIGIAMGTNCAPMLTNIYLLTYKMNFLIRLLLKYTTNPCTRNWLSAYTIATMSRYIDDILGFNYPGGFKHIMYDERGLVLPDGSNGLDGLYPARLLGPSGVYITYPLALSIVHDGTSAAFMDVQLQQNWQSGEKRYRSETTVYSKFDAMPALLKHYRPFPHILSQLASRCKENTVISALCRCTRICSTVRAVKQYMQRLVGIMIANGYQPQTLEAVLLRSGLSKIGDGTFYDLHSIITSHDEVTIKRDEATETCSNHT